jgi:competence protein ComFC
LQLRYTDEVSILDVLFPKRCVNCRLLGAYLCPACFSFLSYEPEKICLMCNRASWNGLTHPGCIRKQGIDGSFSALAYNSIMKRLLFAYKYRPYVADLKQLLGELFYEGIIQNESYMNLVNRESLFLPIPLHAEKSRKRGYNHALLLAREIGDKMGIKVIDELVRTRKTKSQFLLKKEERAENLKDAFTMKKGSEAAVKGKQIFLVDDLVTTGATLREAAKVLKKVGAAEVHGLTLAHGH